jgi:hypothetical protein
MSTAEQVATYKTSGSGFSMQALNAGTLIVHKGCVYTGSATYETDGVPLTLVVFPEDSTTWDGMGRRSPSGTRAGKQERLSPSVAG